MLNQTEIDALLLSLKVALWAIALGLPLAVFTAYRMARSDFRGKFLLDGMLHIPLVVPPVVIGFLLLIAFSHNSSFGAWLNRVGLNPSFQWQGAAIASGIMAFPLMVRSIRQAFEAEPKEYGEVAQTLGLSPYTIFRRISLPHALPGILSGSVLGFARAIGEFGATITFVANIPGLTQTLPLALFQAAQTPGGEEIAARFALLCLIPAIGSLIISEWLSRRHKLRSQS
ncbi:molybdate ABC transporter permease subunit [Kordiimonas laminariae]|uniref:molybdate ABC transporter permease subunit n=1 Tax=Kordiimonas laminariae TaxID=2917717 RepID=UPI001FF4A567|nr:molybdate ABC transporter permease subunit [Kordiimonas laminariae]MCK0070584.1 molybdate ABC transporter permease subunit [Kordiimonas laminariae]